MMCKRHFYLFLIPALFFFIINCGGTPKIYFQEQIYDFGKAEQKVELVHTFKFKNVGDGTLKIEEVKAG